MLRYSQILGLPVICADSGRKSGVVKDVVFDPRTREVKAILLESKGLGLTRKVVFPAKILNIGGDAVILDNSGCISEIGRLEYFRILPDEGSLLGLKVYSRTGEEMGTVKDVLFDWQTGRVEAFEISDGVLQDIVQGRRVIPLLGKVEFGEDNILVEKEAVEEMIENGGGIKKRFLN